MANKTGKVNKNLEKTINDLLKEVNEKEVGEGGKKGFKYSLTDRCKVIDRALKLEAIRMKADDSGYASAFDTDPDPDPEPE